MLITIDLPTLIDKAKRNSGLNYSEMSEELHRSRSRISEWLNGKAEPSSDEIAYFADKAGLPILETVAALRPEWAHVWMKAAEGARPGVSRIVGFKRIEKILSFACETAFAPFSLFGAGKLRY